MEEENENIKEEEKEIENTIKGHGKEKVIERERRHQREEANERTREIKKKETEEENE